MTLLTVDALMLRSVAPPVTAPTSAVVARLIEDVSILGDVPLTEAMFMALTDGMELAERQAVALELPAWAQRSIGAWQG